MPFMCRDVRAAPGNCQDESPFNIIDYAIQKLETGMSRKIVGLATAAMAGLFVVSTGMEPALARDGGGGHGGGGGSAHSSNSGGGRSISSGGGGRSMNGGGRS